jgi:hypothetical protein
MRFALDIGELSTFVLARKIHADLVLVDDLGARKLMQKEVSQNSRHNWNSGSLIRTETLF